MQIALVTTTINVPTVLDLYHKHAPTRTVMYVIGDEKTPESEVVEWAARNKNIKYITPEQQRELGFKCSELIGFNSIQRRNIGFLLAAKQGADIVVSVDDDNIPLDSLYFEHFSSVMEAPWSGIKAVAPWFDVGRLIVSAPPHRGFPYDRAGDVVGYRHVTDVQVGVAAGVCLGDPDISAYYRMANRPEVHNVSELLRAGVAVTPRTTWTVFNSQNTAIRRSLIPAWFMWPHVHRMDDIYASLVVQRVMREHDMATHFGQPFVWQQRNEHNLVTDLRGEIDGYDDVLNIADLLDHTVLLGRSITADCRRIWETLGATSYMPAATVEAAFAYLEDCEAIGWL